MQGSEQHRNYLFSAIINSIYTVVNFVFRACQLIALVLTISGCNAVHLAVVTAGALATHTLTAPGVLCSSEDSIGVTYHTEEPNDQRDEAVQLIRQHCPGGYIETKRVRYPGSRTITVYATCLQADGSPAVTEPCEYDAYEVVGFGQTDITTPDG